MVMTKQEVLKAIRNHGGEIKTAVAVLDYSIYAKSVGMIGEVPGEIDQLKDLMSFVGNKANEIKDILDNWPS